MRVGPVKMVASARQDLRLMGAGRAMRGFPEREVQGVGGGVQWDGG